MPAVGPGFLGASTGVIGIDSEYSHHVTTPFTVNDADGVSVSQCCVDKAEAYLS
jgi:hypothetical protein